MVLASYLDKSRIEKYYPCVLEVFIALTVFFLPISKAMVEIGTTAALVLWLGRKFVLREKFLLPRILTVPYFTFLSFCGLSLFSAGLSEWQAGIRGVLKWLQYLGFFALCAEHLKTPAQVRRIGWIFLASMTLVTFSGFYQLATGADFLRGQPLHPGRITRITSSLGAPNALAAFYLLAIPLALGCAGRMKPRFIVFFLAALFGAGFILTFSRAAFFALLLSGACTFLLQRKFKELLIILAAVLLPVLAVEPLRGNFFTSINLQDITVGERLSYWAYTWEMIKEHPILGNGLNLYYQKLQLYVPPEEIYRGYAHNSYLQMWAEIGLAGLLGFLIPLTLLFRRENSGDVFLKACLSAGCLAFAMQALFDNHFYALQPAVLFWTFWGIRNGLENPPPPDSSALKIRDDTPPKRGKARPSAA